MKRIFLLLSLLTAAQHAFAQYLTANEMIAKIDCKTFNCFNDFIIAKHFSYSSTHKNESFGTLYLFLCDDYETSGDQSIKIPNTAIISLDKSRTGVGFRTASKSYYTKLLNEFKEKGYRALSTHPSGQSVDTDYESDRFPAIKLMVRVDRLDKEGTKFTSYDFELSYQF